MAFIYVALYHQAFYKWPGPHIDGDGYRRVEGQVREVISSKAPQYVNIVLSSVDEYHLPFWRQDSLLLSVYSDQPIKAGDKVAANVKLRFYQSHKNFGVFDKEVYAFRRHITFKGYTKRLISVEHTSPGLLAAYREHVWSGVRELKLNWLYYGLLTGDRSRIAQHDNEVIRHAGLSHLLAISGLHVGLVFAFGTLLAKGTTYLLARRLAQPVNLIPLYFAFGIVLACVYVALTGFVISASRALLMLIFAVAGFVYARQSLSWPGLIHALAVLLLINPFYLLSPALVLSFSAVAIIFSALKKYRLTPGFKGKLKAAVHLQWRLALFMAPLSMLYFGGVSVFSVVLNLLVVWLFALVIMPLLFLYILLSFLVSSTAVLAPLDQLLSGGFNLLSKVPDDYLWWSYSISVSQLLLVFSAYLIYRLVPIRMFALIPLAAMVTEYLMRPKPDWELNILDVGHGLSVVVSTQRRALVYDLGRRYFDKYSEVKSTVLPFIAANSLNVEHTVISHMDMDHSGGLVHWQEAGLSNTLKTFHPNGLHAGCKAGEYVFQNLKLTVLWPQRLEPKSNSERNERSCVIKISGRRYSALLTGDIEKPTEQALVTRHIKLQSDVLISPHHGSASSSSAQLVEAVAAKVVIHSSGRHGRWQMPAIEVSERYRQSGAVQYITRDDGGIRIRFYDDSFIVDSARADKSYWFLAH